MAVDVKLTTGIGYEDDITMRKAIAGVVNLATNATVPDMDGNRIGKMYYCSIFSIASIAGCITGMPFTLIKGSSGASHAIFDLDSFKLSATWIGNKDDTITLVWDGTTYFEVGVANNT